MRGCSAAVEKTEMADLPPLEQATAAIGYTLRRAHVNESFGWYMCCKTNAFAMLTEAYAALTGQDLGLVRYTYAPRRLRDPDEGVRVCA